MAYEILFSDRWGQVLAKDFTMCSIYFSNLLLWKIHGIASINFDCFTTDESNKVKISREIMRYQGYFFKIAVGPRLRRYLKLRRNDVNSNNNRKSPYVGYGCFDRWYCG